MSRLLDQARPYGPRSETDFLEEMNALTRFHLGGCPEYARIWPDFDRARRLADLPWLHVGLFKHIEFRTTGEGIRHERTLKSSATSSGVPSLVALDRASSELQSASTLAIFRDFVGEGTRPLLVLDSSRSLLTRGEVSARVAAALSLRPLASEIHFLLEDAADPDSMKWDVLAGQLASHDELLVYGFTWVLWLAWGATEMPAEVRELLAGLEETRRHRGRPADIRRRATLRPARRLASDRFLRPGGTGRHRLSAVRGGLPPRARGAHPITTC
jgi:hypothetical protein